MATVVVAALPHPKSPGDDVPVKTDTPSIRPPSPSAPPSMFAPPPSLAPAYSRRDSGESQKNEYGRSQSTPMTGPASPIPKRTNSTGTLPPFLASAATLSPPSFHPSNHNRNSSPESRRTRSSENVPMLGSSPESSPQQHLSSIGGTSYHNGQHMAIRTSEHTLYSSGDYDAMMRPKKRHKTSRACDECRRKKIRCDATSEANVEQCSSCKRAGVNCSFSRVPMKRGPTKGLEAQYDQNISTVDSRYIRELEDRLVSLEYSVQTKGHVPGREHSPPLRRHSEFAVGGNTQPEVFNKPHTHSNDPVKLNPVLGSYPRNHLDRLPPIEAIHASPPMSSEKRHSMDYFRPPFKPSTHRHEPMPSHSFHQNQHDHLTPPDRRETVDQSQRKMSFSTHPVHERASSFNDAIGRRPSNLSLFEKPVSVPGAMHIDDAALNRYYDVFHKTLPVLPHNLNRLHTYLAAAPIHLRNALLHAIYALTATDQTPSSPASPHSTPPPAPHIEHTLKACDLVGMEAFIPDDRSQVSLSRNLLHMQILLLLALNADKRAFSPPQVDPALSITLVPSRERGYTSRFVGSMIGAAWGCANELKLSEINGVARKRSHEQMESLGDSVGDMDGEECLARRAWWILVILDRWRSASTSSIPLISDDKICLKESDRVVLGESTFHLVRLSCVLGHIAEVPNSTINRDTLLNLPQLARLLNGELERIRETAERTLNQDALMKVAFCHAKLLIVSHTSDMYQTHANVYHRLLSATKKVAELLQSRHFIANTPLIHHVIGFTIVVLVRLTTMIDTRDSAYKMLHDFIGDRKSSQFDLDKSALVEGYDIITKKFVDHSHPRRHSDLSIPPHHRRESESHYNDSNGIGRLAHLADLAVGEGSEREYPERQYHKPKSEAWRNIGGEEGLDELVKRQGYLLALQTLLQSQ